MIFTLNCKEAHTGLPSVLYYDNDKNLFLDSNKQEILHNVEKAPKFNASVLKVLKIQLGMQCNKACDYCNQKEAIEHAAVSSIDDIESFITALESRNYKTIERVEFCGGEPLNYRNKILKLTEYFETKYPDIAFSLTTNGLLLSQEWIKFFQERKHFEVLVSHDGPGQTLRGEDDLFTDSRKVKMLQILHDKLGQTHFGFRVTLTPENVDLAKLIDFFNSRIERNVKIEVSSIVNYHHAFEAGWNETSYTELRNGIHNYLNWAVKNNVDPSRHLFYRKIAEHATTKYGVGKNFLHQQCNMDRADYLAIDLLGNVLTCENTSGPLHTRGNLNSLEPAQPIPIERQWHGRPQCIYCPVLHYCGGGCMIQDDTHFERSCENNYNYNLPFFSHMFYMLTGHVVMSIENSLTFKKTFQLKQV